MNMHPGDRQNKHRLTVAIVALMFSLCLNVASFFPKIIAPLTRFFEPETPYLTSQCCEYLKSSDVYSPNHKFAASSFTGAGSAISPFCRTIVAVRRAESVDQPIDADAVIYDVDCDDADGPTLQWVGETRINVKFLFSSREHHDLHQYRFRNFVEKFGISVTFETG